jgi:hypothetical protein
MLDGMTNDGLDASPLLPLDENDITRVENKAPLKECVLMFFAAAGSTLCYTAVLSNLVFYNLTMGVQSYILLNLVIYAPMLPITIIQTTWDNKFDRRAGSLTAYSFRGLIGFSVSFICLILMPFLNELNRLLIVALMLGFASATLHGMLKQMASFVYPGCFRLAAAATAGMQASALPVLFVAFGTSFGHDSSSDGIREFYFTSAILLLVCWGCFHVFITQSDGVYRGMERQDSLLIINGEDGIIDPANLESETQIVESVSNEEMSTVELWKKTRSACFVISITVASSMSVACWLNHVKSQNPDNQAFAQVLFYTRLLGDLAGRPATLYRAPSSIYSLVIAASVRLSFVPLFFVYTTTDIIPKNDIAAVVGIFFFAFSSGYLATLVYQLAPLSLSMEERGRNLTRQTGIINVCFSTSILLGFGFTFLIALIFN